MVDETAPQTFCMPDEIFRKHLLALCDFGKAQGLTPYELAIFTMLASEVLQHKLGMIVGPREYYTRSGELN